MKRGFLVLGLSILLCSCTYRSRLHPSNFNVPRVRYGVIRLEKAYGERQFMVFECDTESARRKARAEGHPVVFKCSDTVYVFYPDGSRKVYSEKDNLFSF